MAKGLSLHIGLNNINTESYKGSYSPLRNAENDTHFYFGVAEKMNFNAKKLIGLEATSNNLIDCLLEYSKQLNSGDLCFITYSGHGTRVKDINKDEDDGYDEVMVLFDRLFLDDEIQLCWTKFNPGVKIFLITDSCHSGTVSKFLDLNKDTVEHLWPTHLLRGIDTKQSDIDFENNIAYFKSIKLAEPGITPSCSIIHIGACQDNQLADDGSITESNGKFTSAVKEVLISTGFNLSYKSFFESVKAKLPPWQTPNWDTSAGIRNEAFEKSTFLVY